MPQYSGRANGRSCSRGSAAVKCSRTEPLAAAKCESVMDKPKHQAVQQHHRIIDVIGCFGMGTAQPCTNKRDCSPGRSAYNPYFSTFFFKSEQYFSLTPNQSIVFFS
jgi:hypothetical protein